MRDTAYGLYDLITEGQKRYYKKNDADPNGHSARATAVDDLLLIGLTRAVRPCPRYRLWFSEVVSQENNADPDGYSARAIAVADPPGV